MAQRPGTGTIYGTKVILKVQYITSLNLLHEIRIVVR
jgi:hypothetical protein